MEIHQAIKVMKDWPELMCFVGLLNGYVRLAKGEGILLLRMALANRNYDVSVNAHIGGEQPAGARAAIRSIYIDIKKKG